MTHTPEPWEVEKDGEIFGRYTILEAAKEQADYIDQGYLISDEEGDRREKESEERGEGNRRLIQEAPVLLELAKQAFGRFTDNDMMPPNQSLRDWLEKAARTFYKIDPSLPGRD